MKFFYSDQKMQRKKKEKRAPLCSSENINGYINSV